MRESVFEVIYSSDEVHVSEWTAKRTNVSLIVYWSKAPGSSSRRFGINSHDAKTFYRSRAAACDAARTLAMAKIEQAQRNLDDARRVFDNAVKRVRVNPVMI